tara:strand:+ start:579 stop:689 length:111 start_codon:yes stop_codon:yes gene_type:complete
MFMFNSVVIPKANPPAAEELPLRGHAREKRTATLAV